MRGASNIFVLTGTLLSFFLSLASVSLGQDTESISVPEIEIIGTTPMLGTGVAVEDVPMKVQSFSPDDFESGRPLDLPALLNSKMGSVATVDVQNNPFQKNVSYRGFNASPLLGEAQGIAVYQNGVRVNEPFGDVMQWDLIPEAAIHQGELISSNPVFGLNALGGAIALRLKNGFTYDGVGAESYGGYFGRGGAQMQVGTSTDNTALYFAFDRQHDDSWRNHERSDVERAYLNLAYRNDNLDLELDFVRAVNDLRGNGPAPIELLESNRRAVFTWPDITKNDLLSTTLSGNYFINDSISIQANTYFRRMFRKTLNGDEVDAEACEFRDNGSDESATNTNIAGAGNGTISTAAPIAATVLAANGGITSQGGGVNFLCEEEESQDNKISLLIRQDGEPITEFAKTYAAANTSSTMSKGWGFGAQTTIKKTYFNFDNQLVIGLSADYALTKFHNESFLGTLTEDRTILEPDFPFINFAELELEFAGNAVDEAEFEVGEVGPTKLQAHNRYYGIYGTDTFYPNDNLAVTVGARFNIARIVLDDEFQTQITVPRRGELNGSHRFSRLNPSAGFTYNFDEFDTTLFANYAEANRAPSPVELSCADPTVPCRVPNAFTADPPLKQVVSRGAEVGVRGHLDRHQVGGITPLDWSISGFASQNRNDIIFVSAGAGLGSGYFQNVGDTRRIGGELSLTGRISRVNWNANYNFLESTFQNAFLAFSQNHPSAVNKQIAVERGDEIPGTPQHMLKLGLNHEPLRDWLLGLNLISQTGVYARGDEGNILERTSGHTVVNFHSKYAFNEWAEVFALVDNVFDTKYETFAQLGETGNEVPITELPLGTTNPNFRSPGQPFSAFVGVRIRLN